MATDYTYIKNFFILIVILIVSSVAINIYLLKSFSATTASTNEIATLVNRESFETTIATLQTEISQLNRTQQDVLAREEFSTTNMVSLLEEQVAIITTELKDELTKLNNTQQELLAATLTTTDITSLLEEQMLTVTEKLSGELVKLSQLQQEILEGLVRSHDENDYSPTPALTTQKVEHSPVNISLRLVAGDSLWSIVDRFYKNPSPELINKIAELNNITNPRALPTGSYLTIPYDLNFLGN